MARRLKIKPEFRSQLSEKLMDLGNLVAGALVFGQFVSGKEFSIVMFATGVIVMLALYLASYIAGL